MIAAGIRAELAALQTQVADAKPLAEATRATLQALKLNAARLLTDIQADLVAPNNMLDTWTAPSAPELIVSSIAGLVTAAQDQSALASLRGVVGRATSNLDQL